MGGRLTAWAQVCLVGDPVPGPSSHSFITSALALIPWVHLDSADVPGEHDQLRLMQRGQEFSIRVGSIELMNSRLSGSEQALATLTCARLQDRPDARVLIGGLGMGFTLAPLSIGSDRGARRRRGTCSCRRGVARGALSHLFEGSLEDPRVELRLQGRERAIPSDPAQYDAILLDVDNGPEGMTRRQNDRLYDIWGVRRAHYALRPGGDSGSLVWPAGPSL